ncbi:hypothetical protein J6590_069546 [Homalodisca vitripennis]|nr:hypothetical protein J6590_069546 [Homalodisca vitripennis]
MAGRCRAVFYEPVEVNSRVCTVVALVELPFNDFPPYITSRYTRVPALRLTGLNVAAVSCCSLKNTNKKLGSPERRGRCHYFDLLNCTGGTINNAPALAGLMPSPALTLPGHTIIIHWLVCTL